MTKFINLILKMNFYQKFFLNTALCVFVYWFLDGFGFKPLEDVVFRFFNIVFSWSFDSEFGLENKGYLEPDFIFILCILGLVIFTGNNDKNSVFEDLEKR